MKEILIFHAFLNNAHRRETTYYWHYITAPNLFSMERLTLINEIYKFNFSQFIYVTLIKRKRDLILASVLLA